MHARAAETAGTAVASANVAYKRYHRGGCGARPRERNEEGQRGGGGWAPNQITSIPFHIVLTWQLS